MLSPKILKTIQDTARLVRKSLPTAADIRLYRMQPRGLSNNPQWFVDVPQLASGHPLDGLTGGRFLQQLVAMKAMTMDTWTKSDGSKLTHLTKTIHSYVDSSAYSNYVPPALVGVLTSGDATVTQALESYYQNFFLKGAKDGDMSPNTSLTAAGFGFASTVYNRYYGSFDYGFVQTQWAPSAPKGQFIRYTGVQPGYYTDIDQLGIGNKDLLACLKMMPIDDTFVKDLGVHVVEILPTISTQTVPFPFVRGLSRRAMLIPGSSDSKNRTYVCYYVYGEGRDMLAYSYVGLFDDSADKYCTPHRGRVSLFQSKLSSTETIKTTPMISYHRMYPLSWNSSFVTSMDVKEIEMSEPTEVDVDGEIVSFIEVTCEMKSITGVVSRDAIIGMLEDGYGVVPPGSAEQVTRVNTTWVRVPKSVSVRAEVVNVSGYSIKDTEGYISYGRKRKKACKDNNYLDLQYNEEYTNKTVDNKLRALTTLSSIAMDASLIGTFKAEKFSFKPAINTVTIAKVGETTSYSSTNGGSGVLTNDASIEQMFDVVMPAKFTGDTSMIVNYLAKGSEGYNLEDINNAAAAESVSPTSMRSVDLDLAELESFNVLRTRMTKTEQINFVSSQVTDYAEINMKFLPLINSVSGENFYIKFVDSLIKENVVV